MMLKFLPALSQYNLNRFFLAHIKSIVYATCCSRNVCDKVYNELFPTFARLQTTSVNAKWGQPWLIQPQSFPKQVSGWMLLYAMFL